MKTGKDINISDLDQVSMFFRFFPKIFYCKFQCGWAFENTCSKRHGLIHFRSIKSVHSGIVSMNDERHILYYLRVNERVPCRGTIETLYQSVFNFEYRTLKTIKICAGFQFFLILFSSIITIFVRYNGNLYVITDTIRIYNGLPKS